MRAGAIAWATSSVTTLVNGVPSAGFDDTVRKTLASACIGGAAAAASGGSDEQVLAACGRGAALAAAREV